MMKKTLFPVLIAVFLAIFAVDAFAVVEETLGGQDSNRKYRYTVDSNGDIYSADDVYKYAYMPISYVSATEINIASPGSDLSGSGLSGVTEQGSTEGYVEINGGSDSVAFAVNIPEIFYDGGNADDLILELDLSETGSAAFDLTVTGYEQGNTTAIIDDTITIADGTARGYTGLVTLSSGIGADSDIDNDDTLLIFISPEAAADTGYLYGARLRYRVGLDITQTN